MAAVFLVTLYEYSPLFYIAVVSLCFLITAAMVLGWFGVDVPVILRSSDDGESITPTPEKHMVQVTNPFALDLGSGSGCVSGGVALKPGCLEPCILSCFWGCEIRALQGALQTHQSHQRFSSSLLLEALKQRSLFSHSFHVSCVDRQEQHTIIPTHLGITDFGPLPRERYPLVAVLTLAEGEAESTYDIVSSVTVVHVPDDKYNLSARILFQYLLTSLGSVYELKPLFMSADGAAEPTPPDPQHSDQRDEPEDEDSWSEGRGRDCVVCQNAAVNRVLLPCRHACVCDSCVSRFQHCPICRAFVLESFVLGTASDR
ncbi:Cell growth regulator with RING finger domain protein 1 [Oryzias melastigma]|uniref:Cell growth regulator with RING finger domain protein 1 n=1 Tax=Oryzias melastigma TaxID=30732 RepID=A0A3B3C0W8_ORYME|nr:cell growth regulator with RING finger domain protein 1 isoform X1 [Oryzias melastigma]KAF6728359.1 Cell growth regulator with RING finger domain protein 1 [Oryzias melastigma]